MSSRFRGCFALTWLLGCAALLAPSGVRAQDQAQYLVADPVDFDFSPLVHSEIAQASNNAEPGTENQPVTVTPGESKAAEEGSLAKAAQNPIASLISLPIQWNSTPNTQWAPNLLDPNANVSVQSAIVCF